jgi:inorganic pyrophosphatase
MFAALTMISVGKAAAEIISEVRRQFREVPGLKKCILMASEGIPIPKDEDVLPDSDKCVEISTRSSVREMVAPGGYAILAPLFIGFLIGPRCLMGMLVGSIGSGAMIAIMMSNSGGAWDNGKKLCEKLKIKKTDQGKACIVGDTVGDPFKDTSGPALNILLKLMSMISLTVAPLMKLPNNPKDSELDWGSWYYGLIPLVLFVILSFLLVDYGILTWVDPLGSFLNADGTHIDGGGGDIEYDIKQHHSHTIELTDHKQSREHHINNLLPEYVDLKTAKRMAGHKFSQENFDALEKDSEGRVNRADILAGKHESH